MSGKLRIAALVVGIVLTLSGAASWGQLPASNDTSDANLNVGGGSGALVNTTGNANTAYGNDALNSNTTASANAAFGASALFKNTTGHNNTAIGTTALYSNTTGTFNTATGYAALFNNTGSNNTANGFDALYNNMGAGNHTAVGYLALYSNNFGYNHTAVGFEALYRNSGGTRNLALGYLAGFNQTTGNNNIYLASYGVAGESDTVRLGQDAVGDSGDTKRTFIAGVEGVSVIGSQVLINSEGQLGVLVSSARYKRDIQDMGAYTEGLLKLRPVTFRYKEDPEATLQYGLIAEEVAKVYPELVVRGDKGEVESVQYHQLIAMLLNEVQHQSKQIAELKAQNEAQGDRSAELAARLNRLEAQAGTAIPATGHARTF